MDTTAAPSPTPTASTPAVMSAGLSERRGWLGVLSVALGSFVLVLSEFLPIGLLPSIAIDLHIGVGTAGLMIVATGLLGAVSAPLVTVLTSRVDRRIVLWSLTGLLVVADVVGATAANFGLLLVARMLLGVAIGGFWAIGAGIAPRLVAPASVIRASSFITAGISVATVVSLPLGALISSVADWRVAFLVGAVLGVVALVGQLVLLPAIPAVSRIRFASLVRLVRIPRARVGLIATAFVFIAQFAAYTYVSPYLEDVARVSSSTITVALLVFGVAGIAGNFVAGVTLSRSLLGTVGVGKVVLAVAVVLLPLLAGNVVGVFVLLVVWGFVWGGLPLSMQTWMSQASPQGAEGGLALFVTTIQLSLAAGSIVGGLAVTGLGLGVDFFLAGGLAALGAVVALTLGRGRRGSGAGVPAAGPASVAGSVSVAAPASVAGSASAEAPCVGAAC